jgi:hypothetical protein
MHRIALGVASLVKVPNLYGETRLNRDAVHVTEPPNTFSTGC